MFHRKSIQLITLLPQVAHSGRERGSEGDAFIQSEAVGNGRAESPERIEQVPVRCWPRLRRVGFIMKVRLRNFPPKAQNRPELPPNAFHKIHANAHRKVLPGDTLLYLFLLNAYFRLVSPLEDSNRGWESAHCFKIITLQTHGIPHAGTSSGTLYIFAFHSTR